MPFVNIRIVKQVIEKDPSLHLWQKPLESLLKTSG